MPASKTERTLRTIRRSRRSFYVDDDKPTFWDRFEAGCWEPETLDLLDELLKPNSTFIDIGAWVGPTSLWAAFTAEHVLALEADPAALTHFSHNLRANPALAERIEVMPYALHTKTGSVAMGAQRKPGDSMSSVLLAGSNKAVWQARTITPETLAQRLLSTADLIIKMDIEGGEYALLPAMPPLIDRARAVLVSFHHELTQRALGWNSTHIEKAEAAIFDLFPGFEHRRIGKSDAASVEWAFIRN